nr:MULTISPECIES: oligosaccharide flippase family protein [unclassified Mycolicibacterium]
MKLGAIAQTVPIIAGYGTVLLTTPYVVGQLGLHDFGIWSITGAIAQYAALLDLGVSRATSRYVALFHAKGDIESERAVVGICVVAMVVLGAGLTALSFLTSSLLDRVIGTGDPGFARFLLLCAVAILTTGLLARVLTAASVGRGRQLPANIGLAILTTLQAVGGVAALTVHPSLRAFAAGNVAGTIVGLVVVVATILLDERHIIIGRPSANLSREIVGYGIKSQIAAAGGILMLQSGKLIAGIIVGPAAAGVYELASRLAMGAQVLGAAAAAALTPHLTRLHTLGGMNSVSSEYETLTRRNTAVAVLVPFAMAATSFSGIPLWLGEYDGQVVLVLLALLPGIVASVSTGVCTAMLSAIGRPDIIAKAAIVAGVGQSALGVGLGCIFGFAGIAAAFAVGVPAANVACMWYMHRQVRFPMKLYFRGVCGPYAVGIIAAAIVLPIGLLCHPHSRQSALWPFTVSALLFCAIYAALGWTFDYLPRVPLRRQS